MKNKFNTKILSLLLACLVLTFYACEEDDETKPTSTSSSTNNNSNNNFKVGGSISAEVNGRMINYSTVEVKEYGLAMNKGRIMGIDSTNQDTTHRLSVHISLVNPATGTFDEKNLKGHGVLFEEIENSSNDYYSYTSNNSFEVTINAHEKLGERNDTTFYRIIGTFVFNGEVNDIAKPYFNTVTINNGSFDYIAFLRDEDGW